MDVCRSCMYACICAVDVSVCVRELRYHMYRHIYIYMRIRVYACMHERVHILKPCNAMGRDVMCSVVMSCDVLCACVPTCNVWMYGMHACMQCVHTHVFCMATRRYLIVFTLIQAHIHTYMHIHIYIYIYIYLCICLFLLVGRKSVRMHAIMRANIPHTQTCTECKHTLHTRSEYLHACMNACMHASIACTRARTPIHARTQTRVQTYKLYIHAWTRKRIAPHYATLRQMIFCALNALPPYTQRVHAYIHTPPNGKKYAAHIHMHTYIEMCMHGMHKTHARAHLHAQMRVCKQTYIACTDKFEYIAFRQLTPHEITSEHVDTTQCMGPRGIAQRALHAMHAKRT